MDAQLQVDRKELLQTLKSIGRLTKPSQNVEAVISYQEGSLRIALPGMEIGVSAAGQWADHARVSAQFLLMMAKVPPDGDLVSFRVENGRLRVNGTSTTCTWEADPGSRIALPLNPPFKMILSLAYHYTPDDIDKSGLGNLVADAEKRRDALIGQALAALNEFGVTRAELRALVDEKMRGTPRP